MACHMTFTWIYLYSGLVCVCVYLVVAGHHMTQAQVGLCDVISAGEESSSEGAELHVCLPAHTPELPQRRLQLDTHRQTGEVRCR